MGIWSLIYMELDQLTGWLSIINNRNVFYWQCSRKWKEVVYAIPWQIPNDISIKCYFKCNKCHTKGPILEQTAAETVRPYRRIRGHEALSWSPASTSLYSGQLHRGQSRLCGMAASPTPVHGVNVERNRAWNRGWLGPFLHWPVQLHQQTWMVPGIGQGPNQEEIQERNHGSE